MSVLLLVGGVLFTAFVLWLAGELIDWQDKP